MARLGFLFMCLLLGTVECELNVCKKSLEYLSQSHPEFLNSFPDERDELNSRLSSGLNKCVFTDQFTFNGRPVRFHLVPCAIRYPLHLFNQTASEEPGPDVFCLPNTCSWDELLEIVKPISRQSPGFHDFLNRLKCESLEDGQQNEFRLDSYAFIVFTLILAVLIIIATTLDCLFKSTLTRGECETSDSEHNCPTVSSRRADCCGRSIIKRLIDVFSILSSINRLVVVDRDSSVSCIYGLKVFSIVWIIIGHTYIFSATIAGNYFEFKSSIRHQFLARLVLNCSFAVDTFFLSSGFLSSYLLIRRRSSNPDFWKIGPMLKFCFNRYWRLTPVYAFVLWFYTSILNRLGNGPFWYLFEARNCERNWWHNLLYINSYDKFSDECMSWTWYLSNDMQFSILSAVILALLLAGKVKFGLLLTISLILTSSAVTFAITYHNRLAEINGFLDLNGHNYINLIYQKPYCRVGAYLVGLLTGYLIHKKELLKRIDPPTLVMGDMLSSLLLFSIVFVYSSDWSFVECSYYFSLSRLIWSICVCWLIVSCHLRPNKWINQILSLKMFACLSRLSYSVYLIHPIMITFYFYTQTKTITVDHSNVLFFASLATVFSFMFAFLVSLIVELPFAEMNIFKKKSQ